MFCKFEVGCLLVVCCFVVWCIVLQRVALVILFGFIA